MARHRRPGTAGIPEQLCRFVASEWPGAACAHEALRMWQEACAEWLAADSGREPLPGADAGSNRWWLAGGSNRCLPFGETGRALDVLREAGRLRRGMPPCPDEYRPAVHQVNGPPKG